LNLQSFDYKAGVLISRPPSLDEACDDLLALCCGSEDNPKIFYGLAETDRIIALPKIF